MIYVGTDDGLIQVSENGGESWRKIEVQSLPGVPEFAFVNDIKGVDDTVVLVDTIIMMAKNLGLEVIAEGVETEQELVYLHRKGCLVYQGYYFSKPVEEEQFVEILRAGQIESAKPVPAEVSAN